MTHKKIASTSLVFKANKKNSVNSPRCLMRTKNVSNQHWHRLAPWS
nr:MAG TPA: hypothetical protein [Caudoviricetes sp.]